MTSQKNNVKDDSSHAVPVKSGSKSKGIVESINDPEKKNKQDSEEFDKLLKKYHKISRDIRMSALIEEKKELEKMIKSPAPKYYEGSREDRLQALEEERELMEKLNDISKKKH